MGIFLIHDVRDWARVTLRVDNAVIYIKGLLGIVATLSIVTYLQIALSAINC